MMGSAAVDSAEGAIMSEKAEQLKAALAELSSEDRAGIQAYLDDLQESSITPAEWEDAWLEVCTRRLEDLRSGRVIGISAEVAMARLKEKYG
jgi:hypothetical protein